MSIVQVIQSNQILPIDRRANGAAPPVEKNKKKPFAQGHHKAKIIEMGK